MEPYTLTTASEAVRKSKSTVLRAIQKGRLSATRTDSGGWLIDPSELARVYPSAASLVAHLQEHPLLLRNGDATDATSALRELQVRLEAAEGRIADKEAQLADTREQIHDLRQQRDKAQEQLAAVLRLTDQRQPAPNSPAPARRSWWPWRRG
jgi:hypothetical protein